MTLRDLWSNKEHKKDLQQGTMATKRSLEVLKVPLTTETDKIEPKSLKMVQRSLLINKNRKDL